MRHVDINLCFLAVHDQEQCSVFWTLVCAHTWQGCRMKKQVMELVCCVTLFFPSLHFNFSAFHKEYWHFPQTLSEFWGLGRKEECYKNPTLGKAYSLELMLRTFKVSFLHVLLMNKNNGSFLEPQIVIKLMGFTSPYLWLHKILYLI